LTNSYTIYFYAICENLYARRESEILGGRVARG